MDKRLKATETIKHIRIDNSDQELINKIKKQYGFVSDSNAIRIAIRNFKGVDFE